MPAAPDEPLLSAAARAFVDGDVALLPHALDDDDADALVTVLVGRHDAARLQRLADAPDKALAKRARKALHLLRTRGVALPAATPRAYRAAGPYADETPSLATIIDGRGERIVWLVRSSDGGFDVFQAELSDTRGIIGFEVGLAPRKEWRERMAQLVGDGTLGVTRIARAHARQLIEQAYQRTLAAGRVPPETFARARLSLGHYEPEARHPAHDLAPPLPLDEVRSQLASLHELRELHLWVPSEETLRQLDLEVGNVVTSKLVIDQAQRQEQLEAAVDRVADRSIGEADRALLADRLDETAYLLAQQDRLQEARLATTAATLTRDASVAPSANGFLRQLLAKLVKPLPSEP